MLPAACLFSEASRPTPHFTGKQRDPESGNDYFGARYYNWHTGRFLIPDWSAKVEPVPYAKLDNPQSLNLYDYMLDNPLGGVDADGHWPFVGAAASVGASVGIFLAKHPAIEAGLKTAASSLGISAFGGLGGKLGTSDLPRFSQPAMTRVSSLGASISRPS